MSSGRLLVPRSSTRAAALAFVFLFAQAMAAAPPTSVPVGNHVNNFQNEGGGRSASSGWDPAWRPSEDAAKDALIAALAARGVTTYDVGLPGTQEPNALRTWPFDSSESITDSKLAAAGFPTINLTGVAGPVYFIDGYSNCGPGNKGLNGCPNLKLGGDNTKVVISHSAFGAIIANQTGSPEVWIMDSLIDAVDDQLGGLHCQECDSLYMMYSELLGGDDSCKMYSDHYFYRSHIHAPELSGSEHADGCQCSGPCRNVFMVETNMDFLFRKPNAGYWLETTFGDAGPIYTYRNVLSGGNNPTRIVKKSAGGNWLDAAIYKDNLYLGRSGNVSWALQEWANGGSSPITIRAAGNIRVDGTPAQSFQGMSPPTAADDAKVTAAVNKMNTWVAEIRARSGVGPTPPPTTPPPSAPLVAPTLLD